MSFSNAELYNNENEAISDYEDEETQNKGKNLKMSIPEMMEKIFKNGHTDIDADFQEENFTNGELREDVI